MKELAISASMAMNWKRQKRSLCCHFYRTYSECLFDYEERAHLLIVSPHFQWRNAVRDIVSVSDKNNKEDVCCKVEAKMYEHLFKIHPSPGWTDTRRACQYTRHNLDEYLAMGEWKEYSFNILPHSYLCLFPSVASRIRLASESEQKHECSLHGLLPHMTSSSRSQQRNERCTCMQVLKKPRRACPKSCVGWLSHVRVITDYRHLLGKEAIREQQ